MWNICRSFCYLIGNNTLTIWWNYCVNVKIPTCRNDYKTSFASLASMLKIYPTVPLKSCESFKVGVSGDSNPGSAPLFIPMCFRPHFPLLRRKKEKRESERGAVERRSRLRPLSSAAVAGFVDAHAPTSDVPISSSIRESGMEMTFAFLWEIWNSNSFIHRCLVWNVGSICLSGSWLSVFFCCQGNEESLL